MSTHTPGPWRIAPHSKWLLKIETADRVICDGFSGSHEDYANARLIAAAPDLLAALARLVESPGVNEDMLSPETIAAADAARAAIAKAQGGAL